MGTVVLGECYSEMEMVYIGSCYLGNARRILSRARSLFLPRTNFETAQGAAGFYHHLDSAL